MEMILVKIGIQVLFEFRLDFGLSTEFLSQQFRRINSNQILIMKAFVPAYRKQTAHDM